MKNHRHFRFIASLCLLFGNLLLTAPGYAAIGSVSGTTANPNVSLDRSATVTIVWSVFTADGSITSTGGTFTAGATLLGTVSTSLSNPALPGTTAILTETVQVPADVVYRAHKLGYATVTYSRTFSDLGPPSGTGSVAFNITTGAAAGFGLKRLSLFFDDGSPVRVLPPKEPIAASAEINFSGSGLIQGVWEVASPASTAGEPIYRPLANVRHYLVGGDRQVLKSPPLPSDSTGLYLVRLRITDPVPDFDQPVIRYFVSEGRAGAGMPALPLALVSPPTRILLEPETLFVWQPIKGARIYQFELCAVSGAGDAKLPDLGGGNATEPPPAWSCHGAPDTGMLLPATQTQMTLSAATRTHLQPGRRYLWRVLAIGGDGSLVGESPVREIRLP